MEKWSYVGDFLGDPEAHSPLLTRAICSRSASYWAERAFCCDWADYCGCTGRWGWVLLCLIVWPRISQAGTGLLQGRLGPGVARYIICGWGSIPGLAHWCAGLGPVCLATEPGVLGLELTCWEMGQNLGHLAGGLSGLALMLAR